MQLNPVATLKSNHWQANNCVCWLKSINSLRGCRYHDLTTYRHDALLTAQASQANNYVWETAKGRGMNLACNNYRGYIPYNNVLKPSKITVMFWAYHYSLAVQVHAALQHSPSNVPEFASWAFVYRGDPNYMTFTLSPGGLSEVYASSSKAVVNKWQHWTGTFDGAKQRLYCNGNLESDVSNSSPILYTDYHPINIGSYISGVYPFNGLIDDFRIYNRALLPGEVASIYQDTASETYEPLRKISSRIILHDEPNALPANRKINTVYNTGLGL